ncbi:MAG: hypothetical protein ACHQEM_12425 [Chitinophagales bacterium]
MILLLSTPFLIWAQEKGGMVAQEKSQAEAAGLVKKLANPIARLICVPFQNSTESEIGIYKRTKNTKNFQPVVLFKLSEEFNVIKLYVIPIATQYNLTRPGGQQSGLSDITVSAFFSPGRGKSGWTRVASPDFIVPIATNTYLGKSKFGIGPTVIALHQSEQITNGALANQIWAVAGRSDKPDVNQLFSRPFFTFNWKSGNGFGIGGEITEDCLANTNLSNVAPPVTGITKLEKQNCPVLS